MAAQTSTAQAVKAASETDVALITLTAEESEAFAEAAVNAAPATQVRRPWRATVRTVFQLVVALAAMLPLLVSASGVEETIPAVAGLLAIAGGLTRVMALPQVEEFLEHFVPFLAASPHK